MINKLYIDLETFSSVDISNSGSYKYFESIDFEILILCYAFDNGPITTIDLAQGEIIPDYFKRALFDSTIELHAHNANFERNAFKAIGINTDISRWHCTAVKSSCCGLPRSLSQVSEALQLEEKGKLATGKALIRFFSCPIKPTKTNGYRVRNLPHHDLEKWNEYKRYCVNDVEAEREIDKQLASYETTKTERDLYVLDQEINDRGIMIDLTIAYNAIAINDLATFKIIEDLKELTGLENPNSLAQLKQWLTAAMGKDITTLAKGILEDLLKEVEAGEDLDIRDFNEFEINNYQLSKKAKQVLELRQKAAKTSIKKYTSMLNCACYNNRAHGLFEFCAAGRTGRWAGRLIQLQNLPQNHLKELDYLRELVYKNDYDILDMSYDNIPDILSQLIRTAFIAKTGHTFAVADFSAIEARVIAWLANEEWRLDVFATHGKIYEASAAMMFNIPIEQIGKGSPERQKGKVAELALGYQGAVGALINMGGEKMGLSDADMRDIVRKWRLANPKIVRLWEETQSCAIRAIKTHKPVTMTKFKNLVFDFDGNCLTIELPSGRKLFYQKASLTLNKWGKQSIQYKGLDQNTKKWGWIDSYGGKFIENIIQAIARDLLANSMLKVNREGLPIVMHVHDEIAVEIPVEDSFRTLEKMCNIMGEPVDWAPGLKLTADGYLTKFYKKD